VKPFGFLNVVVVVFPGVCCLAGSGCREPESRPDTPEQVIGSLLKALQTGDCESIYKAMPPDGLPPHERFLEHCEGGLNHDPRAGQKKQDLSSIRFDVSFQEMKGGRASVIVRHAGLSTRWRSIFRLERQDGGWRVKGLFGSQRAKKQPALPYQAPRPGAGADELDDNMADLAGGRSDIGCPEGVRADHCMRRQTVMAESFRIDRHEVTVADYGKCVRAGVCERGMYVTGVERDGCNFGVTGRKRQPMNCISYWGASQFCEWAGKRLPTEVEWEVAARGTGGRPYPWGIETPDCSRVVMKGCGSPGTRESGSLPGGATPESVADMAGNVAEWVLSGDGMTAVIRGGAFDSPSDRTAGYCRRELGLPYRLDVVGFRCAR